MSAFTSKLSQRMVDWRCCWTSFFITMVPGRTTLDLVLRREVLHIPADMVPEFSLEVLPRLADVTQVDVQDGLFTPPTISGPTAVLTLKSTSGGMRAYWTTRFFRDRALPT